MSLGFIAAAVIAVGTAVYSADQQRKGQHKAMDAAAQAREDDARQSAELETQTAVSANAKFAADKRSRQANALALGGGGDSSLGGGAAPGSTTGGLGSGQGATTAGAGSVLGSGAINGGYVPRVGGGTVGGPSSPSRSATNSRALPY